jgi:phosphate:Na+ symporter
MMVQQPGDASHWAAQFLRTDNRELIAEICTMDDAVDKLDEAVKLYVTKLTRESLGERRGGG